MKEILEFLPVTCRIIGEGKTSKGEDVLRVLALFQKANVINGNRRRYRASILERELNRLEPKISNHEIYAMSYHPEDGSGKFSDVAALWDKAWMDKKTGECWGEMSVLPTVEGKNIQAIIKAGGSVGLSSRGRGNLVHTTEKINGVEETFDDVSEDYQMLSCGDFVLGPSVDQAGVVKILENRMNEVGTEKVIENEKDQDLLDLEWQSLKEDIESAAKENFRHCFVKDFDEKIAIIEICERNDQGEMKSLTFKVPFEYDEETEIVTLDWKEAVALPVDQKNIQTEQKPVVPRYGRLSELEMKLSGAKENLTPEPTVHLSSEELRYISPRLSRILREEKFKK